MNTKEVKATNKSSPRPWVARLGQFDYDNGGGRPVISGQGAGRHRICVVDSVSQRKRNTPYDAPDEIRDANAALIVKAVNEYEALSAVAEAAKGVGCGCSVRERDSGHRSDCELGPLLMTLDRLDALRRASAEMKL